MGLFKSIGKITKKPWFKTLAKVAPAIAAGVAGGPLAPIAMTVLRKVLGEDNLDEKGLEAAITSGNPEVYAKLQLANQEFLLEMEKLDITEQEIYLADVDSARQREVAVKDKMPAVLAVLAWAQWAFIVVVSFFGEDLGIMLNQNQRDVLMYILATSQTLVVGAFAYYHGSSQGSKAKTDAFAAYLKNGVGKPA